MLHRGYTWVSFGETKKYTFLKFLFQKLLGLHVTTLQMILIRNHLWELLT